MYFNPLPPYGGRPCILRRPSSNRGISIHSLRMEGDSITPLLYLSALIFQSTPSVWRETRGVTSATVRQIISIHSLRMEGDDFVRSNCRHNIISIHSLRMEGDVSGRDRCSGQEYISIHSLRMEGDRTTQSISSGWMNFNPLPPYGGRR